MRAATPTLQAAIMHLPAAAVQSRRMLAVSAGGAMAQRYLPARGGGCQEGESGSSTLAPAFFSTR